MTTFPGIFDLPVIVLITILNDGTIIAYDYVEAGKVPEKYIVCSNGALLGGVACASSILCLLHWP